MYHLVHVLLSPFSLMDCAFFFSIFYFLADHRTWRTSGSALCRVPFGRVHDLRRLRGILLWQPGHYFNNKSNIVRANIDRSVECWVWLFSRPIIISILFVVDRLVVPDVPGSTPECQLEPAATAAAADRPLQQSTTTTTNCTTSPRQQILE